VTPNLISGAQRAPYPDTPAILSGVSGYAWHGRRLHTTWQPPVMAPAGRAARADPTSAPQLKHRAGACPSGSCVRAVRTACAAPAAGAWPCPWKTYSIA